MTATRRPTMTSLYLSSHYTTGKRTDCQDDTLCSLTVVPFSISLGTEGFLLHTCTLSSSKTNLQWNLKHTASTWHRMNKISSLITCKRSTVGNKSLPFLTAGPRRNCKRGHTSQRTLLCGTLKSMFLLIPLPF